MQLLLSCLWIALQFSANFTDNGTFKVMRAGKEIGRETFNIRLEEKNVKATSNITLDMQTGAPITLTTELVTDQNGQFRSYRAGRTGEPKKDLSVTLENQVAVCEQKTNTSSESTPVVVAPGFNVLDTNVFHHFEMLAQKLLVNPAPAELPVLIPQEAAAGTLKVQAAGKETIQAGRARIQALRYNLDSGQVKISIWIDDAGKLYRISVPQSKAEVIRVE